jgi:hypothetical protein
MADVRRQTTEDPPTSRNCRATTWQPEEAAYAPALGAEKEAVPSGLEGRRAKGRPGRNAEGDDQQAERFFRQYTSQDAIAKFTKLPQASGSRIFSITIINQCI